MNCPVCNNAEVSDAAAHCDACGSDLSAYHHILKAENQRKSLRMFRIVLGALLLMAVVAIAFAITNQQLNALESVKNDARDSLHVATAEALEHMKQTLLEKDQQIAKLNAEIETMFNNVDKAPGEVPEGKHTVHVVQPGESIWIISEKYHGDGHRYDEIADHNEIDNAHHIQAGDTIIIQH